MSYRERYQRKNFISLCLSDEELSEIENIADRLNMKRAAAAMNDSIDLAALLAMKELVAKCGADACHKMIDVLS